MKEVLIARLNAILGLLPTPAVANRDTPTEEADGNIVTCLFDDLYMKVADLRDDIQNDELTGVNPDIPDIPEYPEIEIEPVFEEGLMAIMCYTGAYRGHGANEFEIVSWNMDEIREDSDIAYAMGTAIQIALDEPQRLREMFFEKFSHLPAPVEDEATEGVFIV